MGKILHFIQSEVDLDPGVAQADLSFKRITLGAVGRMVCGGARLSAGRRTSEDRM